MGDAEVGWKRNGVDFVAEMKWRLTRRGAALGRMEAILRALDL